jgi:pimeloyl-ACP methyl ester carboxylesterase
MSNDRPLIFIHGLNSSGSGFKGRLLRELFPDIMTPNFDGPLQKRMAQLTPLLAGQAGWVIIGSSFGGLMGALFAYRHPRQVKKLILLAPALLHPEFATVSQTPLAVPTIIYHGQRDSVIPLKSVRNLAERVFLDLTFHTVDDDHRLHRTVQDIDWTALVT